MNFEALNWLINSILNWFKCNHCFSKVEKNNINIKSIEGNSVVLDIYCPNCSKTSLVKSEVISVDLSKHLTKEQINNFKNTLESEFNLKLWNNIKEEEIVKLSIDLKKENLNVKDLFDEK